MRGEDCDLKMGYLADGGGMQEQEARRCPRQIVCWFAGSTIVTTENNFLFLDVFGHIRWDPRPHNYTRYRMSAGLNSVFHFHFHLHLPIRHGRKTARVPFLHNDPRQSL